MTMIELNVILPSKPRVVSENETAGVYEIEGLYPGYGHTLGNSLRRIILSSLPGYSITSLKISGASHEFSTLDGVREDVINIILNLKRIKFKVAGDEPQTVTLSAKGMKTVTAKDLDLPGQVEVVNPDQTIAVLTDKKSELEMELKLEKGLGYVPKEVLQKEKVEVGNIAVDATFTPIRKASYEVENMRVGNRTDFNKLRINLETDGTVSPREALEKSIEIMIKQLKAVVGFKEEEEEADNEFKHEAIRQPGEEDKVNEDILKVKVEDLNLSVRTMKALSGSSIRTVAGILRRKEADLTEISGLGEKGINEIKNALGELGVTLK